MAKKTGRPRSCHCGECKKCKQADYMRKWYQRQSAEKKRAILEARDKDKVRAADRRRNQKPQRRADQRRRSQKWEEDHPLAAKARYQFKNAVRDGKIVRPDTCESADETCNGMIQGHHTDYTKPFEVMWLCQSHHARWHRDHGSVANRENESTRSSRT